MSGEPFEAFGVVCQHWITDARGERCVGLCATDQQYEGEPLWVVVWVRPGYQEADFQVGDKISIQGVGAWLAGMPGGSGGESI
jgi:hypothetical protein